MVALLFSGDFFQFNAVLGKYFPHGIVIGQSGLIRRFFSHKTHSNIQCRCNAGSENGGVQFGLRCEFIGTLDEIGGESGIGNNEITAADYLYAFHIPNTLFNKGKTVREREYGPVFLHSKNNHFIAVVVGIFHQAPVAKSKGIAVHYDGTAVLSFTGPQNSPNPAQVIFQGIRALFQKGRIRLRDCHAFEAHMLKNRHILRFCENLVSCNTPAVGFTLQVADNTAGQPLLLIFLADGNIPHDTAPQGTGADELSIVIKAHGIINISCKSQVKALQKLYYFCFFRGIGQEDFMFSNHSPDSFLKEQR